MGMRPTNGGDGALGWKSASLWAGGDGAADPDGGGCAGRAGSAFRFIRAGDRLQVMLGEVSVVVRTGIWEKTRKDGGGRTRG